MIIWKKLFTCTVLLLCLGLSGASNKANPLLPISVNIGDFKDKVQNGDWAPAIQAAIDSVSSDKGYQRGTTIYFPPGIYRIDQTIKLGRKRAHHGVRLSGYGAVLIGSKKLDRQSVRYKERAKEFKDADTRDSRFALMALPGELDFKGKNVGPAILELCLASDRSDPPPPELKSSTYEGMSLVIEGLTFHREANNRGVGIKIPAMEIPKNITFRDVVIHNQNVGVHVNHCYQIRFESCILRGNTIGIWGRNHFNGISVVNTSIRRGKHGMIIGPNAGTWGSSGIYIAGSIFESLQGYGILSMGGNQTTIIGCYFEANANHIGIFTPYGYTTIDTNFFGGVSWRKRAYNKVKDTVVSGIAHIVISSQNVVARSNRYYTRKGNPAILVFGLKGKNVFDSCPQVGKETILSDNFKAASANGTGAYVYNALKRKFEAREFAFCTVAPSSAPAAPKASPKVAPKAVFKAAGRQSAIANKEVELFRQKLKELEATYPDKKDKAGIVKRIDAQLKIGHARLRGGDFVGAREEYAKAFAFTKSTRGHMCSGIQTTIADSYMKEQNYSGAVKAYTKAQKLGLGGWRIKHVKEMLAKARKLAQSPKVIWTCSVCLAVYDSAKGNPKQNIKPGTAFADLPAKWRCPACGAPKDKFLDKEK